MTLRQLFKNSLTDTNNVESSSLLLEDFNYFINKTIQLYINERYGIYDVNQLTTDDLRVLKTSAVIDVVKCSNNEKSIYGTMNKWGAGKAGLFNGTYEFELPPDYMHMLNCIVIYQVTGGNYQCYNDGDYVQFAATRLTSDAWSTIINDYYNRPLPQRPYYFIHNVNANDFKREKTDSDGNTYYDDPQTLTKLSTAPYLDNDINGEYHKVVNHEDDDYGEQHDGTDMDEKGYNVEVNINQETGDIIPGTHGRSNFRRKIKLNNGRNIDNIDREAGFRYGNASKVRCELRFGNDDSVFMPVKVMVDYIKTPQFYRLTQEEVNLTRDTSMVLEFPDYVCYEIGNRLGTIIMENMANQRMANYNVVNKSIGNPVQQLTPQITAPAASTAATAAS